MLNVSVHDLLAPIKTVWDAKSLDDTVTGSIHTGKAPSGTSPPYVKLTITGSTQTGHSRTGDHRANEFSNTSITMVLVATGGLAAVGAIASTIREVMDNAEITLVVGKGTVLYMQWEDESPEQMPSVDGLWEWTINYKLMRAKPENNPARLR